ncbi:hypothetical protein WYO_0838 [Methylobacterium sp. GXF4]|nr:hypothetical protein WYO_0838 [Methylobacterium sp. GXF4]
MCWGARPVNRMKRTHFLTVADAPSSGPIQRRSNLPGCCLVVVLALPVPPNSICFLGCDCLDRSNHVLQLGNLTESASRRQAIMLGHCQDERALVRLQAFEEGVELVGHGRAVDTRR